MLVNLGKFTVFPNSKASLTVNWHQMVSTIAKPEVCFSVTLNYTSRITVIFMHHKPFWFLGWKPAFSFLYRKIFNVFVIFNFDYLQIFVLTFKLSAVKHFLNYCERYVVCFAKHDVFSLINVRVYERNVFFGVNIHLWKLHLRNILKIVVRINMLFKRRWL